MKTWGMILLLCLAIVGCGSVNNTNDFKVGDTVYVFDSLFITDGLYIINKSDSSSMPYFINGFWIKRENVAFPTQCFKKIFKRIAELEQEQDKNWDIWRLANTHEIEQDERIARLQESEISTFNFINSMHQENGNEIIDLKYRIAELEKKISDEQQRNQEIIQLLLDYYGVKIKYISEHMELVPETGN